jgi:hypothetical protein
VALFRNDTHKTNPRGIGRPIQFPNGKTVKPTEVGEAEDGNPSIQIWEQAGYLTRVNDGDAIPVNPTPNSVIDVTVTDAVGFIAAEKNVARLRQWLSDEKSAQSRKGIINALLQRLKELDQ